MAIGSRTDCLIPRRPAISFARARDGVKMRVAPLVLTSKETADRVSEEIKRVRANQSTPMSKLARDGMAEQFGGRIVNSSGT